LDAQGTGFAPVIDADDDCFYYSTSRTELSSNQLGWRIWQLCYDGRHSAPKLLMAFVGSSASLYPAIDQICGLAASKVCRLSVSRPRVDTIIIIAVRDRVCRLPVPPPLLSRINCGSP
jgi:hypothetical protein